MKQTISDRAAIFDLGNTLVFFDIGKAARRLMPFCGAGEDEISAQLHTSDNAVAFEEGRIKPQEFFDMLRLRLGLSLDYKAFVPIWNEIFEPNEPVVKIFSGLPCRRYIFSNTNFLHQSYIFHKFRWVGLDTLLTSSDLEARKPAPEAFERALARIGLPPEKLFFVDDLQTHVDAALKFGMHAVRYHDPARLEADLSAWLGRPAGAR